MQKIFPKIKRILEDKLVDKNNEKGKTLTGKVKDPIEIYGINKKDKSK